MSNSVRLNVPTTTLPPCVSAIGSADTAILGDICSHGHCSGRQWTFCSLRELAIEGTLFHAGDRSILVHRVVSGAVRIFKILANGRRQVVGFSLPGDFIGLGLAEVYQCNAQAVTPTRLRCIPKAAFHQLARKDAEFAFKLYEATANELTAARDLALTIGQRNSEESLAAFLLALSRHQQRRGLDAALIDLPMSRTDIADFLGLTIETVSRSFTKLKKRRFLSLPRYRSVRLLDTGKLNELAEGHTPHMAMKPASGEPARADARD